VPRRSRRTMAPFGREAFEPSERGSVFAAKSPVEFVADRAELHVGILATKAS
jgi:hypothetical protein